MKRAAVFILLFALSYFPVSYAIEIKSELKLVPVAEEYHEGDVVEIDLKVWPIENAELDEFKKIEGTSLFNSLEVTQINSIENSENNADVVIVKATAVVAKAPGLAASSIQYKNTAIPVSVPAFKFIPLPSKQEDFYVLDQKVLSSHSIWFALLAVLAVVSGIFLYFKKFRTKKDDLLEMKRTYQNLFSNAEKRQDFEKLYGSRREWVPLLSAETNAHREFYKLMEQHQYKKEWSSDILMEIKLSFDIIRGSFS